MLRSRRKDEEEESILRSGRGELKEK